MAAAARKDRKIQLLRSPSGDDAGVFSIREGRKVSFYTFREVPCDIGGRGFAVRRLERGPLYHVRIGSPVEISCECLGFLRHGRCKHILALATLANNGLL